MAISGKHDCTAELYTRISVVIVQDEAGYAILSDGRKICVQTSQAGQVRFAGGEQGVLAISGKHSCTAGLNAHKKAKIALDLAECLIR